MLWDQDRASQEAQVGKNPPANSGDGRDMCLIPGSGRAPGGGHDNPLQYSCLENSIDKGAWWATVHGVAKSQKWLKQQHASTNETRNVCGRSEYDATSFTSAKVNHISEQHPNPRCHSNEGTHLNQVQSFYKHKPHRPHHRLKKAESLQGNHSCSLVPLVVKTKKLFLTVNSHIW